MSERRKSLSAMTADIGPVPEIPVREEPPAAPPSAELAPPRRRSRKSRETAAAQNGARPSARDLAAPVREPVPREALKADVPAELDLIRRLHRYRLDKGIDMRDQVAIAVDEWLTREGY